MFSRIDLRMVGVIVALCLLTGDAYAQGNNKSRFRSFNRPGTQNAPQARNLINRPGVQNPGGGFETAPEAQLPLSRTGTENKRFAFDASEFNSGPKPKFQTRSFNSNRPATRNTESPSPAAFAESRSGTQNTEKPEGDFNGSDFDQPVPAERPGFNNGVSLNSSSAQGFDQSSQNFAFNPPPARREPTVAANTFSRKPILIVCSAEALDGLNCTLRGGSFVKTYHLEPGQTLRMSDDRFWSIEYHKGGDLGNAKFRLIAGQYNLRGTDEGWGLFRRKFN